MPMLAETTGTTVAITADMLKPLTDSLVSNVQVLVPVGVVLMGVMIGVSLIPRIVYKFI